MELKEHDLTELRGHYADVCIFVKQIEMINLSQLYRALKSYLACLILPDSASYLPTFKAHLSHADSWLAKAQLFAQAEAKREFVKAQADEATQSQALWQDIAKKLTYLMDSWDSEIALSCQQIVEGIDMLIRDNIPLQDVQEEIIQFAEARQVFPLAANIDVSARFTHLWQDALVNSSTFLTKMARNVMVQAELFLNRLGQAGSPLSLDAKQTFHFEANYRLCEFVQEKSNNLRSSLETFSDKLADRIAMRLNRISLDPIIQRYQSALSGSMIDSKFEKTSVSAQALQEVETQGQEISLAEPLVSEIREEEKVTLVQTPAAPAVEKSVENHEHLRALLASHDSLVRNIVSQVSLHRLQLSCLGRIKASYGKFSLFPVFRKIAVRLTEYQHSLMSSLHEIDAGHAFQSLEKKYHDELMAIKTTMEHSLEQVKTYLATLNIHDQDYSVVDEISSWQSRLHRMIMTSSEKELVHMESRLHRIESIHSPYLRAALIMKFDTAKMRLNDMIIANMHSWSSRFVDKETVISTLAYLGIHLHPSHLNKIAPTIHLPKKRKTTKKSFYSAAADYSLAAWRNMRDWLDKRVIE